MEKYLENMVGNHTHAIKLAPGALIFVNTQPTALGEIPLTRVKAIKSKQIFCDPVTGNVIARTGVELRDGKIAYTSTRLKVTGGVIAQIETAFDDDSQSVAPAYVTFLDPLMTTIVPTNERASRSELEADPEHGIVIGFTIILYSDNKPSMYVSEVFKILSG